MRNRWNWLLLAGYVAAAVWTLFGDPVSGSGLMLAQTIVTGARATAGTQGVLSNTRVIDMSDTIHLLDPNTAPLTALTMKLRKSQCVNPKFEWLEDDYLPTTDTVNGTVSGTTTATTVTVDNGGYFRGGDVLKVIGTGEVLYVSSVATNVLTVIRSVGDTAAAAINDGVSLLIIGNANYEGATGRTLKSRQKTALYGYTQIFRWPYSITGTLENSELYGGNDFSYQGRKSGLEHRIQIERAFLFGERAEDTSSGNTPLRFTDGVIRRISTNVTTLTTMTFATFETFLRSGFRYGPAAKMFFASRLIISYINQIATSGVIETIPASKSFPLALTEYVSGHGKLYLVTHNLLEGDHGSTHNYQGWGLMLDLDSIFYRYLQNRDTHVVTNIQANDEDGREDEWKSECGLMLVQEKNHAVLKGVNAAS